MTKNLPFAIMSDQHYHNWSAFSEIHNNGMNSRLRYLISQTRACAAELRSRGGNVIYCAGDMFHVRGQVEPSVLNPVFDLYAELIEQGLDIRCIPGNHDLASNETTKLGNAMQSLEHAGAKVNTTSSVYFDHKLAMIPWEPDLKKVKGRLENVGSKLDYAIIHAPLNDVIKGIPDTGLDPAELAEYGFKGIFVGHYHNHVNFNDKVYSIGAIAHNTWSDVGSKAGFVIVNEDQTVEHIDSECPRFIDYDANWTTEEAEVYCEGNYVRVQLGSATNSEITNIRRFVTVDCGALGCIVKAIPVTKTTARTQSISAGASLGRSISDWVALHAANMNVDKFALDKACQDVLNATESESV